MNYTAWAGQHLKQLALTLDGKSIALWQTPPVKDRQTILLVHGVTGDHFGLVPLVAELSGSYNCLILELPGHGASDRIDLKNATALQQWFSDAHQYIEQHVSPI
ncbi:MAG: alpha/beta fold hydrolase, partial [Candidatus Saccharimonadales bacterium]